MTGQTISCACGATQFRATDKPIIVAECYCKSCRTAGAVFEALPGAPPVLEPGGGTRYALHRKDRLTPETGTEHLREHRLTPDSKTRRIVATCCHSPMFLDLAYAHWLSIYAKRIPEATVLPLEERTMLSDMPPDFTPPADACNSKTQSLAFFGKLFAAWAGMGFRIPKNDWVSGPLAIGNRDPQSQERAP